jgi:hypothetical protein
LKVKIRLLSSSLSVRRCYARVQKDKEKKKKKQFRYTFFLLSLYSILVSLSLSPSPSLSLYLLTDDYVQESYVRFYCTLMIIPDGRLTIHLPSAWFMPKARFTVNAFFLGLVEAEFEAISSFYDFFSHRQFRDDTGAWKPVSRTKVSLTANDVTDDGQSFIDKKKNKYNWEKEKMFRNPRKRERGKRKRERIQIDINR